MATADVVASGPRLGNGPLPPQDLEAETAVLGALLLDETAISRVLEFLKHGDFYRENNGQIYRAAATLFEAREPIDNVTVADQLQKMGVLEQVGGRAHLALLRESVPTAANVEHYGRIVKGHAYKRRLISAGSRITEYGFDPGLAADEAINQAHAQIHDVAADRVGAGLVPLGDHSKSYLEALDARIRSGGGVHGIKTGWPDLDGMTNGFEPQDLIVVAARPSMGKTTFVLNIAVHAAVEERRPVGIFSLEMSTEQLLERMLCALAGIDSQRLQKGVLSKAEYDRLKGAVGPLADAPIYVDESPMLDALTFRLRARQSKATAGLEMIVVDYLQRMSAQVGSPDAGRVQEVSAIARTLKSVARELRVPVIAVSQLSRAPEMRQDKRPILSDLRESGEQEQEADLVLFLFREDYYDRVKPRRPGVLEVIVAKHRRGPTGTVELLFKRDVTQMVNLENRRQAPDLR